MSWSIVNNKTLDIILSEVRNLAVQVSTLKVQVVTIQNQEIKVMALGQQILDAITAENTLIDSFIALVQGLVANNTIDQATADAIKAAIKAESDKVNAAIVANTPPTPPTT